MKAMVLKRITALANNRAPLELVDMPVPVPKEHEILLKVSVCGVCHTELDEIEGRTPPLQLPIIPGHQVVGRIVKKGAGANRWKTDERVGIAWIHSACGVCKFCKSGTENLCGDFKATGRDAHGGYAEYTTVHENFAYLIP
jgi:alcohol dehydrogenase, propanol-preferring